MAEVTYPIGQGVSGVYGVRFNGRVVYVGGSTRCMYNRMSFHKAMLRAGNHPSYRLQNCWNQINPELSFVVLEVCEPGAVREREAFWATQFVGLLNERIEGVFYPVSEQTREKMKIGAQRRVNLPGHREHLRERAKRQWAEGRIGRT